MHFIHKLIVLVMAVSHCLAVSVNWLNSCKTVLGSYGGYGGKKVVDGFKIWWLVGKIAKITNMK